MNVARGAAVVGAILVVVHGTVAAQDPVPPPTKVSEKAPPPAASSREAASPEIVRLGTEILREHAERSRAMNVLVAGYVQKRTTKLAKEPLVSNGRFTFVREPGCVVFRTKEPRETITRLRREAYEVYRPQKKQLERFVLPAPALADTLFAALGGDADLLLRDFAILDVGAKTSGPESTELVVVMEARNAAVREHVTQLGIVLKGPDRRLAAVWYCDHDGDLVKIQLVDPVVNPKDPPSVEFELAPGTAVIEHPAKKR